MTCSRPGCPNEVIQNKYRPVRYCDDPVCRRLRMAATQKASHKKRRGGMVFPPFTCRACGLLIYPADNRARKYCSAQACLDRRAKDGADAAEKRRREKRVAVVKMPSRGHLDMADRGAKMANLDRGTRDGFRRYWSERPFHFGQMFPGKTVPEAWEDTQGAGRV